MVRPRDELLDKSLERIRINIKNANVKLSKKLRKRAKKEEKSSNFEDASGTFPEICLLDSHGEKVRLRSNIVTRSRILHFSRLVIHHGQSS